MFGLRILFGSKIVHINNPQLPRYLYKKNKIFFNQLKHLNLTKNKDEILEEEFDKFDDKFKPEENSFNAARQVFEAYATDKEFREKIDKGRN